MKRDAYINLKTQRVLLANFIGSEQEKDLSVAPNCKGYGRIHHFRRHIKDWIQDPLPIDPAAQYLKLSSQLEEIEAEVFQMAYCNMQCWYCFVPNILKNGMNGNWISVGELIDMMMNEKDIPHVIDLSGGNPELTPEWIYWFMIELEKRKISKDFYLWSDDTLSTKGMFDYLNEEQIQYMASYKGYGKVCCFKGFDELSYKFNSSFSSENYYLQFDRIKKYIDLGFDTYGYVTLTASSLDNVKEKVSIFVDKLQEVREWLPLRVIPLKIMKFSPTCERMGEKQEEALHNQYKVLDAWNEEIYNRFTFEERNKVITQVR